MFSGWPRRVFIENCPVDFATKWLENANLISTGNFIPKNHICVDIWIKCKKSVPPPYWTTFPISRVSGLKIRDKTSLEIILRKIAKRALWKSKSTAKVISILIWTFENSETLKAISKTSENWGEAFVNASFHRFNLQTWVQRCWRGPLDPY